MTTLPDLLYLGIVLPTAAYNSATGTTRPCKGRIRSTGSLSRSMFSTRLTLFGFGGEGSGETVVSNFPPQLSPSRCTPGGLLPYPILRRLSRTSESRAPPRSALLPGRSAAARGGAPQAPGARHGRRRRRAPEAPVQKRAFGMPLRCYGHLFGQDGLSGRRGATAQAGRSWRRRSPASSCPGPCRPIGGQRGTRQEGRPTAARCHSPGRHSPRSGYRPDLARCRGLCSSGLATRSPDRGSPRRARQRRCA